MRKGIDRDLYVIPKVLKAKDNWMPIHGCLSCSGPVSFCEGNLYQCDACGHLMFCDKKFLF